MRRIFLLLSILGVSLSAQELKIPNKKDSLHFGILGDTGTGGREQFQVAEQLAKFHAVFPMEFVLLLGDNLYGGDRPADFERKFERPYRTMIQAGIEFYATLGNHDDPNQRFYKGFNMNGQRYYTFKPRDGVRFFSLDSNYMDKQQIEWIAKELDASGSEWKIAFFHHPLYSSGERHGPAEELRQTLEPMFLKYGVSVVFSGHEHFYERLKPQKGIHYFIEGGSAKLRKGNIRTSDQTAVGFDTDQTFMLCEIDGDQLYFQTISRSGSTVDSGVIARLNKQSSAATSSK